MTVKRLCLVASLLALSAGAADARAPAAGVSVPAMARAGGRLVVHARGLIPGRYALFLARTLSHPRGGQAVVCLGQVGPTRQTSGTVDLGGSLPSMLDCRTGIGPVLSRLKVTPGRYQLLVASQIAPAAFSGRRSFVKGSVRLTS